MPRKTKSNRSQTLKALWLAILTLGGLYTVVQFENSLFQLFAPRLSYETSSTSTWGAEISPTGKIFLQTVSFTFTIRNDGLLDSGAVFASVFVSGGISGSFIDDYQNGFNPLLSDAQSYDYYSFGATSPIIPSGSNFVQFSPNNFFVKFSNIPAVSHVALTFNVYVVPSTYYAISSTGDVNATSDSGYQIVESTPSYRLESGQMQLLFISYLAIIAAAAWVAAMTIHSKRHHFLFLR